jgi:hypothetical protein
MSVGAVIFMAITWLAVIALNVYCFTKIFLNHRK